MTTLFPSSANVLATSCIIDYKLYCNLIKYIWNDYIWLGVKFDKSNVKPAEPIIVAAYGTIKNGAEICLNVLYIQFIPDDLPPQL